MIMKQVLHRLAILTIFLTAFLQWSALATPSPLPSDIMPVAADFSIPTLVGNVRGGYQDLKFGALVFDSGKSPFEETAPGEVRRWVYQAQEGTIGIENSRHIATCIRATRINVLTPQQEFYYEFRVSALEGGCTMKPEDRVVELTLVMTDFIVKKYNNGKARYFGQSSDLYMFPMLLRAPERITAASAGGGYFLSGQLAEVPFIANLKLELMLRSKGESSCSKIKFDPEKDPYSSVMVTPLPSGKWGATVPNTEGAICMRLIGGGWQSAVSPVILP